MLKRRPSVLGIVMTVIILMIIGTNVTKVEASAKVQLDSFNSGVATLLDPTQKQAKMIKGRVLSQKSEVEYKLVMENAESTLKVYEEPSEEALAVGEMYNDCGGEVLDQENGWTQIKSGELVGWIKDENLLFGEEAVELATSVGYPIAKVTGPTIRVRAQANPEAEVLGYMTEDTTVAIVEIIDETWISIQYKDEIGYAQRKFVSEEFKIDSGVTYEQIDEKEMKEMAEKNSLKKFYDSLSADDYDRLLLANLIYCEAGGESYEGQVAVGSVVLNRVRSSRYANTIHGVVYASGQFTPALTGKLERVIQSGKVAPSSSCYAAADEALSGYTNVGDALYFRVNNGSREGHVIGNHVFY